MALEKTEEIVSIAVVGKYFNIEVKTEIIVTEDGKEISRSNKRKVYFPDDELSDLPERAAAIAKVEWTDKVKAEYDKVNVRKITSGPGTDFSKKLDEDGNPLPDRENADLLD